LQFSCIASSTFSSSLSFFMGLTISFSTS
jgi:hypothetical protein